MVDFLLATGNWQLLITEAFSQRRIFSFTFASDFVYNLAKLAHASESLPVQDSGAIKE
jgi:hypothetical protein